MIGDIVPNGGFVLEPFVDFEPIQHSILASVAAVTDPSVVDNRHIKRSGCLKMTD